MEYRISVIMGIYNCAPTLAEALDSLLAQTYQDFKVIMCDDGSTDNTYEVAQSYVDHYPGKFILIKNERNMKLAATLNHCLEYVDTEYVARMDGDDISLPERFATQVAFLDAHPKYAFVSTPMIYFDENGDYRTGTATECPAKEDFGKGVPFCHAPVMMRRHPLLSIGNYTAEPRVERIEDYYLWFKFYSAGFIGYNLQVPLYKMRNGRDAFLRRKASDRWKAYKVSVEVKRGLNLPWPRLSCTPALCKILVPPLFVRFIQRLYYSLRYRSAPTDA